MEYHIEYRTLTDVPVDCIHETFLQAFSDYQVPMKMSFASFEKLLKRNGFSKELSAGAFADGKLVGVVLNGMRTRDGVATIYDTGTGVAPAYRGAGVADGLLKFVKELCIINRIDAYQLEVIQNNDSAVSLYKKQGFRIKRALNCYSLRRRPAQDGALVEEGMHADAVALAEEGLPATALDSADEAKEQLLCREEAPDRIPWALAASFWDYPPSWQNGPEAVFAIPDSFLCVLAECAGALIGYGIVDKRNGDIAQLAVAHTGRRKGVATTILRELQERVQSPGMTALNVDARDEGLNAFLKARGFRVYVTQYEMIMDINHLG